MKILLITYNWPPKNTIGSLRPYYWAKYLSKIGDVKVDVLTSEKYSFDEPLTLNMPALNSVDVFEIPYRDKTKVAGSVLKRFLSPKFRNVIKNVLGFSRSRNINMRQGWAREARKFIQNEGRRYDVVISTFSPEMSHQLGSYCKEISERTLWVADYRDLWSLNHIGYRSESERARVRRLEAELVWNKCDVITTVSEGLANKLKKYCQPDVLTVTNGHDVDVEDLLSLLSEKAGRASLDGKLTVLHAGSIYPGFRDPEPFLRTIESLILDGSLERDGIKVEFVGKNLHHIEGCQYKYSFVEVGGEVSREEAIDKQRRADYLLLLETSSADAEGVLTGKVFEYITSGTPIICSGVRKTSELAALIEETHTGIVLGNDNQEAKDELKSIFRSGGESCFRPDVDKIMGFGQSKIVNSLYVDIVKRLS